MINVTINGQPHTLDREMTIPEVIELLQITHPRIAVAHNGTVVPRDDHAATTVRTGDTLEIVRMVGGG